MLHVQLFIGHCLISLDPILCPYAALVVRNSYYFKPMHIFISRSQVLFLYACLLKQNKGEKLRFKKNKKFIPINFSWVYSLCLGQTDRLVLPERVTSLVKIPF